MPGKRDGDSRTPVATRSALRLGVGGGDTGEVNSPTVDVRPAAQRFLTRGDGIESQHCFSFGEHYDPDNVGCGPLQVSNEERVAVGAGFGDHPHHDAEIITWVLSGSLVHEDSWGHRGVVYPGLAQRMSAGQGIVHSERNDLFRVDPDQAAEPVHFVQMWLRPDEAGGAPSYRQSEVDLGGLDGGWVAVASGSHPDAVVTLGTAGATLWVTRLGVGVRRSLPDAALVHGYLARGEMELEGFGRLSAGDSLRITGGAGLWVTGRRAAELLVWTLGA